MGRKIAIDLLTNSIDGRSFNNFPKESFFDSDPNLADLILFYWPFSLIGLASSVLLSERIRFSLSFYNISCLFFFKFDLIYEEVILGCYTNLHSFLCLSFNIQNFVF